MNLCFESLVGVPDSGSVMTKHTQVEVAQVGIHNTSQTDLHFLSPAVLGYNKNALCSTSRGALQWVKTPGSMGRAW